MDCLSLPDGDYNCTNRWGVNCTNPIGFDFDTMWNITQQIQRYCPTDPRLWLKDDKPATSRNAALTGEACTAIAGSIWQKYPAADIWVRLTTWKFPLLQLVASSPRPPLSFAVEGFVILHLLGDPVGTIKDLLRVVSSCQGRANFWRKHLTSLQSNQRLLDHIQVDNAWKSFTIITISYDEWGKGDEVQEKLKISLAGLLTAEASESELETFLQLCNLTADALAADRSTKFLPIIVAQGFFVGAIAVAITKITSNTSNTSFFINIEAHSIAFSAMYFWILPAVFLSSVIGVSQTKNAVPRILRRFQTGLNHDLPNAKITFPNHELSKEQRRIINGGIYSWQPDRKDVYASKQVGPLMRRNCIPLSVVVAGTVTACLVSGHVPPDGWEQRLCAQAMILLTWLLSFSLTSILKINTSSHSYDNKARFWLTFVKDIVATIATMGSIVVTQFGIFNRCDSYTRWGRTGLALPRQPEIADVLAYRISTTYPTIVFTSIGLHMFLVPLVIAIRYRHALLVFLQRDDENSRPVWFLEWRWLHRNRSSISGPQRSRTYDSDPETFSKALTTYNATRNTFNDGTYFEEIELLGTSDGHGERQRESKEVIRQREEQDLGVITYCDSQLSLHR